ncbi:MULTISPECIES: RNA polymerase sigma-70 factor [Reichenbachiella]|uniref:RNA polymerase sigma-70 factor n=1 Tax=Reichenbachiella TaxID=156993 RepID=UPI000E6C16FF|nr:MULTISPECIES: RNA polymerase sigma-70 factor [Reichenbachiella]MBU2913497.1 RNA polymerase sigma-70 factor [Reichenbachiella agariperforans]RJE74534.1 hypothetical protein BGP76_15420 [Reichenbachiella sp. MSK19-1]
MTLTSTHSLFDLQNEKHFETVFKSFFQPLCGFAFQYVKDSDTAEEIVQETFTTLWHRAHDIEIKTSVKSYLYGAVRNASLNHLKHQKVVQAHQDYVMRDSEADQQDFLELDELQEKINKAIQQMPEKCREIFELSRFEEKKYKEIAEELNLSIKTVETQMSRALKIMREALGQYLSSWIIWMIYLGQKFL